MEGHEAGSLFRDFEYADRYGSYATTAAFTEAFASASETVSDPRHRDNRLSLGRDGFAEYRFHSRAGLERLNNGFE
jgi:hypothetical protein